MIIQFNKTLCSLGGRIQRNTCFVSRGFQRGRAPVARRVQRGCSPLDRESRSGTFSLRLSLWGRIQRNRVVSWQGIQWGQRPLGTRPCLQGLVCYTFCGRAAGKSGCRLFGHTDLRAAAQADFAGGTPGKDRICAEQNPPVRRRQRELFRSEAEKKIILPLPGKVYKKLSSLAGLPFLPTLGDAAVEQL